ncbi:MAG: hypothetical protein JKY65_26320 [Planctomycetes bacterium]|nr:hypothetical protein [Planctomycetota bacterium]
MRLWHGVGIVGTALVLWGCPNPQPSSPAPPPSAAATPSGPEVTPPASTPAAVETPTPVAFETPTSTPVPLETPLPTPVIEEGEFRGIVPQEIAFMRRCTKWTLYRIESKQVRDEGVNTYVGYPIVKEVQLTPARAAEAIDAIEASIRGCPEGMIAVCFTPHHAIRAEREDGVVSYVICFQCSHIQAGSSVRGNNGRVGISSSPALGVLERLLGE